VREQFANAEAALEAPAQERPNVVLMDIICRGMNGVECVRRLKRLAAGIQVVMLTVYEDTRTFFNALAAGASGLPAQAHPEPPNCSRPSGTCTRAALR